MNKSVAFLILSIIGLGGLSPALAKKIVKAGDKVLVHYTGRLSDGRIFDSSAGKEPLQFTVGEGSMLADFEDAVLGLSSGETRTVAIPAAKAYGEFDETKVVGFERSHMPEGTQVGQYLFLRMSDSNVPVKVVEITDEKMFIDGNHLLAGKDLSFDIQLVGFAKK